MNLFDLSILPFLNLAQVVNESRVPNVPDLLSVYLRSSWRQAEYF